MYNVDRYRDTCFWANLFARFLDETYSEEDLLLFLYARGIVQAYIFREAPTRATTDMAICFRFLALISFQSPFYISFPKCKQLVQRIFGPKNPHLGRSFSQLLSSFIDNLPPNRRNELELGELYHLLLIQFHTAKNASPGVQQSPHQVSVTEELELDATDPIEEDAEQIPLPVETQEIPLGNVPSEEFEEIEETEEAPTTVEIPERSTPDVADKVSYFFRGFFHSFQLETETMQSLIRSLSPILKCAPEVERLIFSKVRPDCWSLISLAY